MCHMSQMEASSSYETHVSSSSRDTHTSEFDMSGFHLAHMTHVSSSSYETHVSSSSRDTHTSEFDMSGFHLAANFENLKYVNS